MVNSDKLKKGEIRILTILFPLVQDEFGLNSKITIKGGLFSLKTSIDRHHTRSALAVSLVSDYDYTKDVANDMADMWLNVLYNEYKKEMLSL